MTFRSVALHFLHVPSLRQAISCATSSMAGLIDGASCEHATPSSSSSMTMTAYISRPGGPTDGGSRGGGECSATASRSRCRRRFLAHSCRPCPSSAITSLGLFPEIISRSITPKLYTSPCVEGRPPKPYSASEVKGNLRQEVIRVSDDRDRRCAVAHGPGAM